MPETLHNAFLSLAVKNGFPAATLYLLLAILGLFGGNLCSPSPGVGSGFNSGHHLRRWGDRNPWPLPC